MAKQKKNHLELVLKAENNKMQQFFIAAWMTYARAHKEKKELAALLRNKASVALLHRTLKAWRGVKEVMALKEERNLIIAEKNRLRVLYKFFNAWAKARKISLRNAFLEEAATELCSTKQLAKSLYAWKAFVKYQQSMRRHVHRQSRTEPYADKQRIEATSKMQYNAIRSSFLKRVHDHVNSIMSEKALKKLITGNESLILSLPLIPPIQGLRARTESLEDMPCIIKSSERLKCERSNFSMSREYTKSITSEDIVDSLRMHTKQALMSVRILEKISLADHIRKELPRSDAREGLSRVRMGVYFTKWKIRFLLNLVPSDCALVRTYKHARAFFSQLKKDYEKQLQRQEEIRRVLEMKFMHRVLIAWRSADSAIPKEDDTKARNFLKQFYFRKWKAYIFKTADKLIKIIKANEHYNARLKAFSLKSLLQGTFNLRKVKGFYGKGLKKGAFVSDVREGKVTPNPLESEESRLQVSETPVKEAEAEESRPADKFINTMWKEKVRLTKGMEILNAVLLKRKVHRSLLHWKAGRKNAGPATRTSWDSKAVKNEIVRIFQTRFVVRGWLKLANENRIILPYQHRESRLLRNSLSGLRSAREFRVICRKRAVLVSLLENVMRAKK